MSTVIYPIGKVFLSQHHMAYEETIIIIPHQTLIPWSLSETTTVYVIYSYYINIGYHQRPTSSDIFHRKREFVFGFI